MKARIQNLWDRLFYKPEPLASGIFKEISILKSKLPFAPIYASRKMAMGF